ncbi:MAG: hypothetical protein ACLQO6_11030 [Desulfomonilaceae bacterium]
MFLSYLRMRTWRLTPTGTRRPGRIRLQVVNRDTGFLVETPEGVALRVRHFLRHPDMALEMG